MAIQTCWRSSTVETLGTPRSPACRRPSISWFATIFYTTYIVCEFSLLFWKIFPPYIVGAFVVFGW